MIPMIFEEDEDYEKSDDDDLTIPIDERPQIYGRQVMTTTNRVSFADLDESNDSEEGDHPTLLHQTTSDAWEYYDGEVDDSSGVSPNGGGRSARRIQARSSLGRTARRNSNSRRNVVVAARRDSPVVSAQTKDPSGKVDASKGLGKTFMSFLPARRQKNDEPDEALDPDAALGLAFAGAANTWDNMAAAAAVVMGGVVASDFRTQRRYGVGNRVLVVGRVAPQTKDEEEMFDFNELDPTQKRKLIFNPVNKYGFPPGKGTMEEERRPPYVYVLATVKKVHFEEDARYYTVTREDNQMEQRADTEYMEPITNKKAEKEAMEAAHQSYKPLTRIRTGKMADKEKTLAQRSGESKIWKYCCLCALFLDCIWLMLKSIFFCCASRIMPRLSKASIWSGHFAKHQARLLLNGLQPYEFKIRLTYVNVLVLCSVIYMFSDTFRLAFFPPRYDRASVAIAFVAWLLLVLELLFEVFIRPSGYSALIHSEKAYAPSTARYINRFHLIIEVIALVLYIPEISCIFSAKYNSCSDASPLSLMNATLMAILGKSSTNFGGPNSFLATASFRKIAFVGNCLFGILRLRIFGVVRHWKRMWINRSLIQTTNRLFWRELLLPPSRPKDSEGVEKAESPISKARKYLEDGIEDDDSIDLETDTSNPNAPKPPTKEEDSRLRNAATIGTALMVINSHRTMLLLVAIVAILPIISTIRLDGGANVAATEMTNLLQGNNMAVPNASSDDCDYLRDATYSWLKAMAYNLQTTHTNKINSTINLLWAEILPVRCDFQGNDGIVTIQVCKDMGMNSLFESDTQMNDELCNVWTLGNSPDIFATALGIRVGEILKTHNATYVGEDYFVTAMFDESYTVRRVNIAQFLLQLFLVLIILLGLSVLRFDAHRLVLNPLRKMLKIVLRYAENPLAKAPRRSKTGDNIDSQEGPGAGIAAEDLKNEGSESEEDDSDHEEDELGHYETEQLISAITKITDLLRKCWGVAGADIISSNLARTEGGKTAVFNPCVPGRHVYALFGFVGICDFSQHQRALDKDVMILINDVARVVHSEVYRWGFGDTGQCNKNLGSVFLMVFRIGDSKEVEKKKLKATEVIFSSKRKENSSNLRRRRVETTDSNKAKIKRKKIAQRKRKMSHQVSDNLQLASLPGISAFADRAVIGFLKSFATIHRDRKMQTWKNDFRLGAGVGAFSVDMMFGMDAGWAVEGAVGSEYKIDATYLSPHVNMASRMMSASKQYGVKLLVSQAVEELLSDTARAKFRHLDTVTVKGSSLRQKIFTYDMRHQGVDFFLFARSDKDADLDAECYAENIWTSDQDLLHMRQHVSSDFLTQFNFGRDQYIAGNWESAIAHLIKADRIMIKHVLDEGFIEESAETLELEDLILDWDNEGNADIVQKRNELGDGPARCLLAFMVKREGVAPAKWEGYRPLTSK